MSIEISSSQATTQLPTPSMEIPAHFGIVNIAPCLFHYHTSYTLTQGSRSFSMGLHIFHVRMGIIMGILAYIHWLSSSTLQEIFELSQQLIPFQIKEDCMATPFQPFITLQLAQPHCIYDSSTHQWVAGAVTEIPSGYQSTTTSSIVKVLTIGGSWSGGYGGKNGEIYDPSANTWSLLVGCSIALCPQPTQKVLSVLIIMLGRLHGRMTMHFRLVPVKQ
ncbi:208f8361-582d-4350-a796-645f9d94545b-CDS [Sclerotinia trifoliorum]|uniref:208f8361-582d-4350-a796-645f9d94545b-CDS n=1 Tax=Sclerotinia trifoliorum TaxID=28548 RepID=A0A8H2VUU6_9HELO|nr:208f8361-582d-4350-a796-645f9d94545b-CDS [Sclerotinia trifoliorum]